MSRSPSNRLAIGIGTCDVAVGLCQSRAERLWTLLQRREVKALSLGGLTAPLAIVSHRSVETPSDRWYNEEGTLDTLRMALAEVHSPSNPPVAGRRHHAAIVLDDFWVNHGVLRGDFRSMRKRDVEEVARAYFSDAFGLEGVSLAIAISVQAGGDAVFASAMPRSLLTGIQETCAEAGIKVTCLSPRLPRLLDRTQRDMPDLPGMIVVVADDLLQVAITDGSHWVAYDAQRLFPGETASDTRLADQARTMFERWADESASTCAVFLSGNAVDTAPFERCFATVHRMSGTDVTYASPALGLMGLAS